LTFGDQELSLSLINIIDSFKGLEGEGMQEVSDAAFDIDNKISFNMGQLPKQKKKALERLDLLKSQREKKFAVRE
jgi:hypothetical protein|tara:strand:- start:720 stop:944 length:225 start_codon:yes stop_codon:yes gene_type:complete